MRLQIQQGLTTEAAQNCRKLVERFPDHPTAVDACLILGDHQIGAGHFDDAIKQLENLLYRSRNLPPENLFRVSYLLGEANYLRGNVSAARDIFHGLALKFGYDRQNTLFNWAICSLQLGDASAFEQAFHELERAEIAGRSRSENFFLTKGCWRQNPEMPQRTKRFKNSSRRFPDSPRNDSSSPHSGGDSHDRATA